MVRFQRRHEKVKLFKRKRDVLIVRQDIISSIVLFGAERVLRRGGELGLCAAMASSAQLRLMSDLKAIRNEPPEGCSASPYGDENLFVWSATVFGPEDTSWEGGIFSLRLIFGEHYPEKPPRVRFTSEVYHPNVYSDGTLCMDIIQDAWSPCHNVSTILTSIQSLLTDPNPASPANPDAGHLYQTDIKAYNRKVRQCVRKSLDS